MLILSIAALILAGCGRPNRNSNATATSVIAAEEDGPSVILDPIGGTAGTSITARGSGWPADEMVILVLEDENGRSGVLTSNLSNRDGEFEATFNYPASERWLEPGLQAVIAYTADKELEIAADFAVLTSDEVAQAAAATDTPVAEEEADSADASSSDGAASSSDSASSSSAEEAPTQGVVAAGGGAGSTPIPPTATWTPAPQIAPFGSINPRSGTAGTAVTVRGGGFPANSLVNVYIAGIVSVSSTSDGPQAYASALTNNVGQYSVTFVMPDKWPDGAPIEAGRLAILVATGDFAVRVTDTFEYLVPTPTFTPSPTPTFTPVPTATPTRRTSPYVDAEPSIGGSGTTVTLRGGGFPANTRVNLNMATFGGQVGSGAPASYATTTTDANGNFVMTFVVPERWPDGSNIAPGKLLLLVATNDYAVEASDVFDYVAATPTPTYTNTPIPTNTPTPSPHAATVCDGVAIIGQRQRTGDGQRWRLSRKHESEPLSGRCCPGQRCGRRPAGLCHDHY